MIHNFSDALKALISLGAHICDLSSRLVVVMSFLPIFILLMEGRDVDVGVDVLWVVYKALVVFFNCFVWFSIVIKRTGQIEMTL